MTTEVEYVGAGIHTLDPDAYHADPCEKPSLTSTIARVLLNESPLHAWTCHPRLNPQFVNQEAGHFDIGTAAHSLLLEGEANVEVVDAKDWRTKAAQEQRDTAYAEGKQPLLSYQWVEVERMVQAAHIQLDAVDVNPPIFKDGLAEQTLIWEEQGVTCRARLDWLRDDYDAIDDYKTTSRTANPASFSRSLFNIGYDIQAAFYLRGLEQLTGSVAQWRWVVQETDPPYALSVVSLNPAALDLANAKVDYAIKCWRECLTTNRWKGYPSEVCYAELPGWEEARWLEKEARES
ncbi:MAG TPA: PD-(D/E)XK nuclease-like domain-containing protein [Dehalococcoidia bacterium]|nr:PD-(D/E)XK nuclease-like domain-containing protein [Dehalococcoidia bacterium]